MAQPLSASGGGLGFDLDLYGAAPEWFGWRPRIFGLDLYGAAPSGSGGDLGFDLDLYGAAPE